jgi:hypothetical protein
MCEGVAGVVSVQVCCLTRQGSEQQHVRRYVAAWLLMASWFLALVVPAVQRWMPGLW